MKSPNWVTIASILLSTFLLYKWATRRETSVESLSESQEALLSEDFWSQVKEANFAKKDFIVRAEYCQKKCHYIVDRLVESVNGQIQVHRLVTFQVDSINAYVCAHVLLPDPNEINTSKWQDDHSKLASGSINTAQMIQIFQSGQLPLSKDTEKNVLIFGTGTGTVFMHLQHHFKKMSITGLEVSKKIIKIGRKWFGFKPSSQNKFLFLDAKDHVKKSIEENHLYDIILADPCLEFISYDKWTCPPPSLYTDEFISNLRKVMKPNGILSMNLLHFDGKPKYEEIMKKFVKYFEHCEFFNVPDVTNILITCYTSEMPKKNENALDFLDQLGVPN